MKAIFRKLLGFSFGSMDTLSIHSFVFKVFDLFMLFFLFSLDFFFGDGFLVRQFVPDIDNIQIFLLWNCYNITLNQTLDSKKAAIYPLVYLFGKNYLILAANNRLFYKLASQFKLATKYNQQKRKFISFLCYHLTCLYSILVTRTCDLEYLLQLYALENTQFLQVLCL